MHELLIDSGKRALPPVQKSKDSILSMISTTHTHYQKMCEKNHPIKLTTLDFKWVDMDFCMY